MKKIKIKKYKILKNRNLSSTSQNFFKIKKLKILKKRNLGSIRQNVLKMKKKNTITKPFKWKERLKLNLSRKRLSKLNMSTDCLEVLLGTCLGDGSLQILKKYVNARFSMRHAIQYKDWFNWKVKILQELAADKAVHIQQPSKDSYGKTPILRFQTLVNPELTVIHSIITKKNHVHIKRAWLNHLTPLSLMCWWLDDGCLQVNWRQGMICCENYSKKEQKILVIYLNTVWHVKARVVQWTITQKDSNKKVIKRYLAHRIKMGAIETKKFFRIIMPYIPCKNMINKVCIRHLDSKLQQRWISELKTALPQFSLAIDLYYKKKFNFPN
jgi:hypothetical protein